MHQYHIGCNSTSTADSKCFTKSTNQRHQHPPSMPRSYGCNRSRVRLPTPILLGDSEKTELMVEELLTSMIKEGNNGEGINKDVYFMAINQAIFTALHSPPARHPHAENGSLN